MHYLYVLECTGGHLYVGVTVDPRERWEAHAAGRGARFTRVHRAERMVYVEPFESPDEADAVERTVVRDLGALRHPLRVAGGPVTGFEDPREPSDGVLRAAREARRALAHHPRGDVYQMAAKRAVAVAP